MLRPKREDRKERRSGLYSRVGTTGKRGSSSSSKVKVSASGAEEAAKRARAQIWKAGEELRAKLKGEEKPKQEPGEDGGASQGAAKDIQALLQYIDEKAGGR